MLKISDILVESSIPGTYDDKFGITNELSLAVNPKLVITHVSGYGQYGDPAYLGRGSYDAIGQAYGMELLG